MKRNIILVAGAALALGLAATAACSVDIVDDLGSGGTGGVGGSTTVGVGGSTATGMGGMGACLSCAEFLTACSNGDPACDPEALCEASLEVAAALSECICTECADAMECGPRCNADTDACGSCQSAAAAGACSAQVQACANDA